ncbi:hypothetical protein [Streptomyces sp. OE57]|uniref:hypothetical protein n=1 Tax=Streptomyces lacaronensis TaxID=3379885 RepID=UPI0039B7738E
MSNIKPNSIVDAPATVDACQEDRGTPKERDVRQADSMTQRVEAKAHAQVNAGAAGGRRP